MFPWIQESESASYLRSGNPGYIAGQPLMAGQLTTQTGGGTTKYPLLCALLIPHYDN